MNTDELFHYQKITFKKVEKDEIEDLKEIHELESNEIKVGDTLFRFIEIGPKNSILRVDTSLARINDYIINNKLKLSPLTIDSLPYFTKA